MKVGDLVVATFEALQPTGWYKQLFESQEPAIVVNGPCDGSNGRGGFATSYEVAWFDAKTTFWHNDSNLELLSENR